MIYRKARFQDAETIYNLIYDYAQKGEMLARSRNTIYETMRDMVVAENEDGEVVGVGGLHITWDSLAEVRSMAVSPKYKRHGIGSGIVKELIREGKEMGVKKIFTLTYKPQFFVTLGFREVKKEDLPHKVWKECIDCPKFPDCDETAMILME
ncbi:MAG: N-acetyltransferase [Selenomonadaceae bacterium]|nr:N-acetyltransferase [Selenomonadaceae bacterium]MDD6398455.1 N-acetyltransferase [Selenomonadaceae bacterium]